MSYPGTAAFARHEFKFGHSASLIRFLAPLVVLLALPLAVIVFAFLLGGAATIAVTRAACRLWVGLRLRPATKTIEAEYVVLDDGRPGNTRQRCR